MSAQEDAIVREEAEEDHAAIRQVNEAAFGGAVEADLVEALRAEGAVRLSVVAEIDRRVVGHTLFSRMWVDAPAGPVEAVALAPVAVLPEWQRQGLGDRLIRHGLAAVRGAGERIVIVLGPVRYARAFGL